MKIGMPILYEYNSMKENIKLAEELDLDFIEMNLNFGYCRDELEHNEKLKEELGNVEVTLHFFDEADFASYDEVVEGYLKLLKRYLEFGKNLPIKKCNVHLNEGPIVTISGEKNYLYEKEFDSYIARLIGNLKKVRDICDEYGVELVLENVTTPAFILRTYPYLLNEGFYFTLDIGHDHTYHDNIRNILLKEYNLPFREFHMHDSTEKKCHLAIGEGNLDIDWYKNKLAKDYAYIVLEVKCSRDLRISVPKFKEF